MPAIGVTFMKEHFEIFSIIFILFSGLFIFLHNVNIHDIIWKGLVSQFEPTLLMLSPTVIEMYWFNS